MYSVADISINFNLLFYIVYLHIVYRNSVFLIIAYDNLRHLAAIMFKEYTTNVIAIISEVAIEPTVIKVDKIRASIDVL